LWGVERGRFIELTALPPSARRLSRQCGILNMSQTYKLSTACYGVNFTLFTRKDFIMELTEYDTRMSCPSKSGMTLFLCCCHACASLQQPGAALSRPADTSCIAIAGYFLRFQENGQTPAFVAHLIRGTGQASIVSPSCRSTQLVPQVLSALRYAGMFHRPFLSFLVPNKQSYRFVNGLK
jgi:hypothetical protein